MSHLSSLRHLVLDEADRMVEGGVFSELETLFAAIRKVDAEAGESPEIDEDELSPPVQTSGIGQYHAPYPIEKRADSQSSLGSRALQRTDHTGLVLEASRLPALIPTKTRTTMRRLDTTSHRLRGQAPSRSQRSPRSSLRRLMCSVLRRHQNLSWITTTRTLC